MNRDIYERVKRYCEEKCLIDRGDGIVLGLSGGADSVFLLLFLKWLQPQWNLQLCAVHIHHGIRGEEADRDEKETERLAEEQGILFRKFRNNIPEWAAEQRMSEEEAGRHYRYQCFEQVRQELGYQRIAVAHHQDDQAETILFQMLRGSGLRGLGGIRPVNGSVIRPLLAVNRRCIEDALKAEGIVFCQDSTNEQDRYTRNKLRIHAMPWLKREIQPAAAEHLAQTAEELQEVWDYIEGQATERYLRLVERRDGKLSVNRDDFLQEDIVLQKQILLKMIESAAGSRKDITRGHIGDCLSLLYGDTGKRLDLPYGLRAGRDYDRFWIGSRKEQELLWEDGASGKAVCLEEEVEITDSNGERWRICWKKVSRKQLPDQVIKKHCTKWFDYAKIKSMPVWRHPESGDFLWLNPEGKRKKVSRLLLDAKISVDRRRQIWVLAEGNHILWIPELGRTSAGYYVTLETQEVLQADMYQSEKKGGLS